MSHATHHYDPATNTIVIDGALAADEEYFYSGAEFGIEVDNLIELAWSDGIKSGYANCTFNGVNGRVAIWVEGPGCDCCAEWTGCWYIQLV